MALKATVYKAELQLSDMDRHHYATHALTLARHPSETDERLMVRVLAFALLASDTLEFGRGLSTQDEPDLWQKDLTGAIEKWIEVGQPDEKRMLKASGRAGQVLVYAYGSNSEIWWKQISGKVARARNLCVMQVRPDDAVRLAALAQRTMQLQCTVQDGQIWLGNGEQVVQIELTQRKESDTGR